MVQSTSYGKAVMLAKDPDRQREIDQVLTIIRNCARRHPGRQIQT
jgi:hypothetical protein